MVAKYIAGSLSAFCVTLALACPVKSQSAPIFVQLPRNVTSALYLPESGGLPTAGIVVMHREANYMNNIACREFARRGQLPVDEQPGNLEIRRILCDILDRIPAIAKDAAVTR